MISSPHWKETEQKHEKAIPLVILLVFMLVNAAFAEAIDLAAMTDAELTDLNARIESELLRRHNERTITSVQEDDGEIIYVNDGESTRKIIFESEEQLKSRLHKIELTTENWDQYLGDFYYPYEITQYNNFGELTLYTEQRSVGFGFKEGYLGCFENAGIKFSGVSKYSMQGEWNEAKDHYTFVSDVWTESNEEYTLDLSGFCKYEVQLEDYECLATTGYIYVLEVAPEISRYLLQHPHYYAYYVIYVGDTQYRASDALHLLYNSLNP